MKKLTLLCLFFASFAMHQAHAQFGPTFTITPEEQVVNPGEEVCVAIIVDDFSDIIGVSFSLEYDQDVIAMPEVTPASIAGLPGLTTANIDVSVPGVITFQWDDGQDCATATDGSDIDDYDLLFEVCFEVVGIYGNHTPLHFTDEPVDIVVNRATTCFNIGAFTDDGYVSIGTKSLTMNISSGDGFAGDIVCLDFEVEDFDCIVSFQNAILWDETVLQYVNSTPSNLQEFTAANIGTTQVNDGILNLSWWTTGTGIDLDDGTQILEVCFEILGECGDNSTVSVGPNPAGGPVEIVDCTSGSTSAGTNIGLLQTIGEVSVNCFDPDAITINVEDKAVCPGETFTVDVTVADFDEIIDLEFNLKWNPDVISLNNNGVTYPNGDPCFLFGSAVNANSSQGFIEVDWSNNFPGCNMSDNEIMMRLSFTAIGSSGTNSTIAIVNPINVEQLGAIGDNIGINNNNGLIEICELNSPTISASSITADAGEIICIAFDVQDFDDILRTQYSISWEQSILEYVGPQSFNLPGLGSFNFLDTQTDQGFVGVEWENATPVTVPDGTTIFELCFEVIGDPDECSPIGFSDLPWAIDVTTAESGGTNVGLNGVAGQGCVENPLDFVVSVPNLTYSSPGSEVCLDVTADGFVQLTEMNYSINWNTSILEFSQIVGTGNLPNFTTSSYDDSPTFVDDGQLVINWVTDNNPQGTTLPDGTSIFQICFIVDGNEGDCGGVSFSGNPEPIDVQTAPTGNANLGMTYDGGQVCVNASIEIVSAIVTDVNCPSVPTGAIDLTVNGGSGSYTYEWSGFNVDVDAEDQTGLFDGVYSVTVSDVGNPSLVAEMEYTVGLIPGAPFADAGADTLFNCFNQGLVLNGTGSSMGPDDIYFWESVGSGFPGSVNPETDSTLTPEIFGGMAYQLTVTNAITGCTDTDTVFVTQTSVPVPEIAEAELLTCLTDTVALDGGDSAFGFDILWQTPNGTIVPGTETDIIAMALDTGMYILTFSNDATGCSRADTIHVYEDIEEPIAMAGDDAVIGCQDDDAPIDGTGSSVGSDFIYQWTPVGTGEICDDETALVTTVCSPGEYQILVTDETNGCTAVDVVLVTADTSKPTAIAGPNQSLDCVVEMVTLDGTASSQGTQFTYTWTLLGGTVGMDQTLDVTVPGLYVLEVMNTMNDCSAISEVTVEELASDVAPAVANASNNISCDVDTAMLFWAGSIEGPEFEYTWKDPVGTGIGSTDSIVVSQPGLYTLTIFNTLSQCDTTVAIMVEDLTMPPMVDAGDDASLGCADFVTLEGNGFGNPNLIYQWQGPGLGCITNSTTLTPEVECTGEYTLIAVDTTSGCQSSDVTMVNPDNGEPGADAQSPVNEFPCNMDEVTLTGSTNGTDVNILWTSVPVVPITGETTLTPTITEPGIYTLTVTSNANGCTSTSTVTVSPSTPPTANAGDDAETDCDITEVTLSGENSTLNGTTLTWVAIDGNPPTNPNDVQVTVGPGTYELTVIIDVTGCSASDTVMVTPNGDVPVADAGNDIEKQCDEEFAILLGDADDGLVYTWTDEDGLIVGNNLTLQAADAGTYTLTVLNPDNNCEGEDSAMVTLASAGESAEAMSDHDPCAADAMLIGNLPEGATGVWSALTGGTIDMPNEASTMANGFSEGENQFTWTLSLGFCEEYSSDTVTIVLDEAVPEAVNDFTTVDELSGGVVQVNVLDNDTFDPDITSFALIDNSSQVGTVEMAIDGTITFTKENCYVGEVQVPYELCSTTCPDLCDEAVLTIDVQLDETENCDEVPNAITPNDDGVNDELVFDILLSNPDFQDNEIIIFNRWGDIVFEAKPYLNDWKGTNDNGKDLPQGTYYYILKLDIANGDIIRGDVTILK